MESLFFLFCFYSAGDVFFLFVEEAVDEIECFLFGGVYGVVGVLFGAVYVFYECLLRVVGVTILCFCCSRAEMRVRICSCILE